MKMIPGKEVTGVLDQELSPPDQKYSSLELSEMENFEDRIERLAETIPWDHADIFLREEVLFVIGGIKGMTTLELTDLGSLSNYDKKSLEQLQDAFAAIGLAVSRPYQREFRGLPRIMAFIYNPRVLSEITSDSEPYAPGYTQGEDLLDYLSSAVRDGYDYSALMGTLLSYPRSAVDFYLENSGIALKDGVATQRQYEEIYKGKYEVGKYDQYTYPVPAASDVKDYEEKKRAFMRKFGKSRALRLARKKTHADIARKNTKAAREDWVQAWREAEGEPDDWLVEANRIMDLLDARVGPAVTPNSPSSRTGKSSPGS